MITPIQRHCYWLLAWGALTLVVCLLLSRLELNRLRDGFDTDSRIAHRLLSQRMVQHDAILATLALLRAADGAEQPEKRLPSLYAQILSVQRRAPAQPWPEPAFAQAETESRRLGRAVLSTVSLAQGRYQMVLAGQPDSYAMLIDIRSLVPWTEWPMPPQTSPVRVTLSHGDQTLVLQPGRIPPAGGQGWQFQADKTLAADSQPFSLRTQRFVGWSELPWFWMLCGALGVGAVLASARVLFGQYEARRRAEGRLVQGQVERLNTLGELAAGMAHELNQPLTAILANTQAAARLLDEDHPELPLVRDAMQHAVQQARRAADVVGRLRRTLERPGAASPLQAVSLADQVRKALYLLEPELQRCQVVPTVHQSEPFCKVMADPVALEQIIHNLLCNAVQALEQVPVAQRSLTLVLENTPTQGCLRVQDSGPGMSPEVLPRVFAPFFTTREGGLGLGLSLCETLAGGMGGSLTAANRLPQGAEFVVSLPLAPL
jgi:signal transduction histidine kinase